MNKEIKKQWVAALRSGKYQQGQRGLKRGDQYCCLGVLCDISGLGIWDHGDAYVTRSGECMRQVLPRSVQEWAGINNYNPVIPNFRMNDESSLAGMNDNGVTFDEIADIIEDKL